MSEKASKNIDPNFQPTYNCRVCKMVSNLEDFSWIASNEKSTLLYHHSNFIPNGNSLFIESKSTSDPMLWNTNALNVRRDSRLLGIWIVTWKTMHPTQTVGSNANNAIRHSLKWQIYYGTYKRFTVECVHSNAKCAIKPSPSRETSKDIN